MNILFDARMRGPQQRGIGRYIDQLLSAMMAQEDHKWVVVVREVPPITPLNVHWIKEPIRWYSLAEQWRMPLRLLTVKADVLHIPHFNVPIAVSVLSRLGILPKLVVTVHDLQLIRSPRTQPTTLPRLFWWLKYAAFRITFWFATRCARRIIAVSQDTADDLRTFLPKRLSPRIMVVPEAASRLPAHQCGARKNRSDSGQARMTRCLQQHPHPFVLTVGSTYPHKRLDAVYEAVARLRQEGPLIDWVHVGLIERLSEEFFKTMNASWVHPVGCQTDEELSGWYHHCLASAYPSQPGSEGYGLPVEEALECGAFVITTRIPALAGKNLENISQLAIIEESEQLVEGLVRRLRQRYSNPRQYAPVTFSDRQWGQCAQETLTVYHHVISSP